MKKFKILLFLYLSLIWITPYSLQASYWKSLETFFTDKNLDDFPSVSLIDIDNDKDMDVFIGTWDGYLSFYRNISAKGEFQFRLENSGVSIKSSFEKVSTGNAAVPFWIDIDGDMDYDLFLGNLHGTITFYENIGNPAQPKLKLINKGINENDSFFHINVGYNSVPFFIDIDNDGDYDLFIGERDGYINFFKNEGDYKIPVFNPINLAKSIKSSFNKIDVGECSYPVFYDIDNDNDYDLFIGNWEGFLFFYRNDGSMQAPYFNEINYGISKKFSFNNYQSEADCRPLIYDFYNDSKNEFVFSEINGYINFYQTTSEFLQLINPKEKIDLPTRMANYYYEISKEKYLNGDYIQAKLILNKGEKYKKLYNNVKLCKLLEKEIEKSINKEALRFKKNFAKNVFLEAIEHLLKGDYKRALMLFNQLKELYNDNNRLVAKYIQIAEKYEQERKKIIIIEQMNDKAINYYNKNQYQKALKIWREAFSLMPENYNIMENIINCEIKIEEAETKIIIDKLIKQARKYINNNQKTKAIEIYARILELGHTHLNKKIKKEINNIKSEIMKVKEQENLKKLDILYEKGVDLLEEKEYEKAMEIFRKVIFYNYCYKNASEKLKEAKEKFFSQEKAK